VVVVVSSTSFSGAVEVAGVVSVQGTVSVTVVGVVAQFVQTVTVVVHPSGGGGGGLPDPVGVDVVETVPGQ